MEPRRRTHARAHRCGPHQPRQPARRTTETHSARQTAEDRLRAQLERLRLQREVEGLTERSRVELEKLELQASARLARLEGASGLTMRQIMASGHTKRIADTIIDTLHDSPLEPFGVLDALEMLEDRAPTFHLRKPSANTPWSFELCAGLTQRCSRR